MNLDDTHSKLKLGFSLKSPLEKVCKLGGVYEKTTAQTSHTVAFLMYY